VAAKSVSREDLKGTVYELFILGVSILSIVNLVLLAVFSFKSQYWWVVAFMDIPLTLILLWDFSYRLRTAPSKRRYLVRGGGVFDFLGCLPALRVFRLFRIVRAVRVIRRLGGPRVIREMRSEIASGTVYLVVFFGLVTLEVCGLLELHFEMNAPGANITTGGDALWWGYVTATTVGYGDQYPVTTGGRLVGLVMLSVGVVLFATLSGFLAQAFLSRKAQAEAPPASPAQEALQEVERLLAEQQRATETLRARLAELEQAKA